MGCNFGCRPSQIESSSLSSSSAASACGSRVEEEEEEEGAGGVRVLSAWVYVRPYCPCVVVSGLSCAIVFWRAVDRPWGCMLRLLSREAVSGRFGCEIGGGGFW